MRCSPPLPAGLRHDWFLPDPARERALPAERQRFRVIGNADPAGFTLTGATDFQRLEGALAAHAGRGFDGFEAILDWGCGCGRVARYAARARGFTGCDIDRENVAWCAANLPGDYVVSAMAPPLPFADASFDLLYGVSIFTHLREPLQDLWLAELRRVLRPGGIALVTVHGRTAIEYAGLDPARRREMLAALRSGGFLLGGKNDQLDGAAEGAAEYFNVFHAPEYVRSRWSRALAVRAIVPGYLYTHDLVVLERPR